MRGIRTDANLFHKSPTRAARTPPRPPLAVCHDGESIGNILLDTFLRVGASSGCKDRRRDCRLQPYPLGPLACEDVINYSSSRNWRMTLARRSVPYIASRFTVHFSSFNRLAPFRGCVPCRIRLALSPSKVVVGRLRKLLAFLPIMYSKFRVY